jgi:hypothetical protein
VPLARWNRCGEPLARFSGCFGVPFEVDQQGRRQCPRLGKHWVDLEALLHEGRRIAQFVKQPDVGHRQVGSGVPRVDGQHFVQRRQGLGRVVLLEEELGQPDAAVEVRGIGGDGLVEGAHRVLVQLRIVATQEPARDSHCLELGGTEPSTPVVVDVDEAVERLHGDVDVTAIELQRCQIHLRHQRIGADDAMARGTKPRRRRVCRVRWTSPRFHNRVSGMRARERGSASSASAQRPGQERVRLHANGPRIRRSRGVGAPCESRRRIDRAEGPRGRSRFARTRRHATVPQKTATEASRT